MAVMSEENAEYERLFDAADALAQALRHMVEHLEGRPPPWNPADLLAEAKVAAVMYHSVLINEDTE